MVEFLQHWSYLFRPQALGSTVCYGSPNPINEALPALAQRACDPTPSVRSCLADVVGNWLLDLPDRYVCVHVAIALCSTSRNAETELVLKEVQIGQQFVL